MSRFADDGEGRKIFVGGLPFSVDEEGIRWRVTSIDGPGNFNWEEIDLNGDPARQSPAMVHPF